MCDRVELLPEPLLHAQVADLDAEPVFCSNLCHEPSLCRIGVDGKGEGGTTDRKSREIQVSAGYGYVKWHPIQAYIMFGERYGCHANWYCALYLVHVK